MLFVLIGFLTMITVDKVSTNADFKENEIMPLLHGTLQFYALMVLAVSMLVLQLQFCMTLL